MPRSVPLSVRISDEDAAFLAKFQAPGAKTPSEKMRAILASARQRHEGSTDFEGCVGVVEEMVRPAAHHIRAVQRRKGIRSDFVIRIYERAPELVAGLVAAAPENEPDDEALQKFEAEIAAQIFGLMEEILDMGLTSRSRTYDPNLIENGLTPLLEVFDLLKMSRDQNKGVS